MRTMHANVLIQIELCKRASDSCLTDAAVLLHDAAKCQTTRMHHQLLPFACHGLLVVAHLLKSCTVCYY